MRTLIRNRPLLWLAGVFAVGLLMFGCSDDSQASKDVRKAETDAINNGFEKLTKSQQVPAFDYSQERQTLIDILTVRARGSHGTAVATSFGGDLLWWCPTVGAPVPSTYQLSNPDQVVGHGSSNHYEGNVLPLGEPSGVYTGDSAATWTLCLDDSGKPFAHYEEANVGWISGVVNNLPADKRAKVDEITFQFHTEKAKG